MKMFQSVNGKKVVERLSSLRLLYASAIVLLFSACQNDDSDFSDIINGASDFETMSIAVDSTDLDEGTENIPTSANDGAYNDYVENSTFGSTVSVNYDGTSATVSGDVDKVTVTVDGAGVKVVSKASGINYVLTGSSDNGYFKIYSDNKFVLTMDGVTLKNVSGAAVNSQSHKPMYVVLASGTTNTLTDGTTYSEQVSGEDMRGTLFSEGQMIFSGGGKLNVYANCKNGIASDDYIRFRPGNKIYIMNTANNGVKAKDGIYINGGVLNIEVTADAAKGINSESGITVSGGRTTVITTGGSTVEANDTSSCSAVKCDSVFTMTAGVVNLKSSGEGGKGLNAGTGLILSGGELNVVTLGTSVYASPKGIKCDAYITVSGGSLYSYSAESSPVDAAGTLTVADGYTTYYNKEHYVIINYEINKI